jgi:hypothetical protein
MKMRNVFICVLCTLLSLLAVIALGFYGAAIAGILMIHCYGEDWTENQRISSSLAVILFLVLGLHFGLPRQFHVNAPPLPAAAFR